MSSTGSPEGGATYDLPPAFPRIICDINLREHWREVDPNPWEWYSFLHSHGLTDEEIRDTNVVISAQYRPSVISGHSTTYGSYDPATTTIYAFTGWTERPEGESTFLRLRQLTLDDPALAGLANDAYSANFAATLRHEGGHRVSHLRVDTSERAEHIARYERAYAVGFFVILAVGMIIEPTALNVALRSDELLLTIGNLGSSCVLGLTSSGLGIYLYRGIINRLKYLRDPEERFARAFEEESAALLRVQRR